LGLSFPEENLIFAIERNIQDIDQLITEVKKVLPNGGVLWIESLQWLAPEAHGSNKIVGSFMAKLVRYCQSNGFTIIANVHTPKAKEHEQYAEPRQRISGPMAWAGAAETIILVERIKPKNAALSTNKRRVLLLPRCGPEKEMTFEMNSVGHMVCSSGPALISSDMKLEAVLHNTTPAEEFGVEDLATKATVSPQTAYRWLADTREAGRVEKLAQGKYRKVQPN
jgi:hypothetical protein